MERRPASFSLSLSFLSCKMSRLQRDTLLKEQSESARDRHKRVTSTREVERHRLRSTPFEPFSRSLGVYSRRCRGNSAGILALRTKSNQYSSLFPPHKRRSIAFVAINPEGFGIYQENNQNCPINAEQVDRFLSLSFCVFQRWMENKNIFLQRNSFPSFKV